MAKMFLCSHSDLDSEQHILFRARASECFRLNEMGVPCTVHLKGNLTLTLDQDHCVTVPGTARAHFKLQGYLFLICLSI